MGVGEPDARLGKLVDTGVLDLGRTLATHIPQPSSSARMMMALGLKSHLSDSAV